MAKRFTDTAKYKKQFIRGLPGPYKLLWDFLYHDCDHAGIWIVDFEIAQKYIGDDMPVTKERALELFNAGETRIVVLNGGGKWFIAPFIEFQYTKLSEKNRAHCNVIPILQKFDLLNSDLSLKINKPLTSPLQGAKEKEQEKETEQKKETEDESAREGINHLIIPQMWACWKRNFPSYTADKKNDFPALGSILRFMIDQSHMNDPTEPDTQIVVLNSLQAVADIVKKEEFWKSKPLKSIANNIQEFANKLKNGDPKSTGKDARRKRINERVNERYGSG